MDVHRDDDLTSWPSKPLQQMSPGSPRASSLPLHLPDFTVGYVYSTEMMQHYSSQGHPEDPQRISRIMQAIQAAHYHIKMKRLPIRPVKRDEALLVHSEDHWEKVQAIQCESFFCLCVRASRVQSNMTILNDIVPAFY